MESQIHIHRKEAQTCKFSESFAAQGKEETRKSWYKKPSPERKKTEQKQNY
jgi:hypothetical protein